MKRLLAVIILVLVIAAVVLWWVNHPQPVIMPDTPRTTTISEPPAETLVEIPEEEPQQPVAPIPAGRDMLQNDSGDEHKASGTFKVTIGDLGPENRLPLTHSCYRANQSPAISLSGAPDNTQAYALMFERAEIDDNTNGDLYWGLYNIPAQTIAIAAGQPTIPAIDGVGAQARNFSSNIGYVGPCIPRGKHNFRLRVFALDADLALPAGLDAMDLTAAIHGHVIDTAILPLMHYYRF